MSFGSAQIKWRSSYDCFHTHLTTRRDGVVVENLKPQQVHLKVYNCKAFAPTIDALQPKKANHLQRLDKAPGLNSLSRRIRFVEYLQILESQNQQGVPDALLMIMSEKGASTESFKPCRLNRHFNSKNALNSYWDMRIPLLYTRIQ